MFSKLLPILALSITSCTGSVAPDQDLLKSKKYLLSSNMVQSTEEWNYYKEINNFSTNYFKFSPECYVHKFQLRLEIFKDDKKYLPPELKGEDVIFKEPTLTTIGNFLNADSLLAFFCTPLRNDTLENLCIKNNRHSFNINLPKERSELEYKWLNLVKEEPTTLVPNEWIPILAYTLPKVEDNTPDKCYYCVLTDLVDDYASWGKDQGIKHYYIVSLRILP